jgi:hypothetical protein
MRIWHLIEPASPDGSPSRLRLLSDVIAGLPEAAHEILSLRTPAGHDPPVRGTVTATPGFPWTGRRGVRTLLRAAGARGPDVLHAWSATAAELVACAAPERPRVATFTDPTGGRGRRAVLHGVLRRHPLDVLTGLGATAPAGVPANHRADLTPVVDAGAIDRGARAGIRESWGADDGSFVVGLLTDRPGGIDARLAAAIQISLSTTGRDFRVAIARRTRHRAEAAGCLGWTEFGSRLIEAARAEEPWRIAPGLDAAIVIRDGAAAPLLPMLWAMAAAVPVIAESERPQAAIAEGGHALLIDPGAVNSACDHLLRLHDDRDHARRLGDAGRDHAVRRHAVDRLCDELRSIYAPIGNGARRPRH